MRFRSLETLIRSALCAMLVMLGSGVASAASLEAIGVLERVSRETPVTWRIDGADYVFPAGVAVPKIGSGPSRKAGEARIGEIVRVSYEQRDGVRQVGQVQMLGVGPESIQDGPHLIWTDDTSATMFSVVDGKVIRSEHDDLIGRKMLATPSRSVPRNDVLYRYSRMLCDVRRVCRSVSTSSCSVPRS